MRQIGAFIAILGAGSFVLNMMGLEFQLLMWIDTWGTGIGTGIRAAMIVLGGAMFFFAED